MVEQAKSRKLKLDSIDRRILKELQADGRIWCGPTRWQGDTAMRISVSSWKTTVADADAAADVILELAATVR